MKKETQNLSRKQRLSISNTEFLLGLARLRELIQKYPGVSFSLFVGGLYAIGIFFYRGILLAYGLDTYLLPLTFEQTLQSTWDFLFLLIVNLFQSLFHLYRSLLQLQMPDSRAFWVIVWFVLGIVLLYSSTRAVRRHSWVFVLVIVFYITLFPMTLGYQSAKKGLEGDNFSGTNQGIFSPVATVKLDNGQEVLRKQVVVTSDKYLVVSDKQKLTIYPISEVESIQYLRRND